MPVPAVPTAAMKAAALAKIRALVASGLDVEVACRRAGITRPTYYRWAKAEASGGLAGLHDGKPTGRPKVLALTPEETLGLRGHALLAGSMDGGVRRWMEDSARPATARQWPELNPASASTLAALEFIAAKALKANRRPSWPAAVRDACRTTAAEDARLRGGKGLLSVTPSARRAMVWQDEAGETHQVLPGTIWESDDMSDNEPYRYFDAELNRETVGRQSLLTSDVFSHALLGMSKIGRKRDAYRVEDIADHLLDTVDAYGLPIIWRFEKGVWDNGLIYGIKAPATWGLGQDFRFGGIDEIVLVSQKHTSRGKGGIENSFRAYQDFQKHKSTSIGAYRGEFDLAARYYRRAHQGQAEALRVFWPMLEAAAGAVEAMRQYNARPQERRSFAGKLVSPSELWSGHQPRPCPAEERWRFLPITRAITVRQGVVEMQVDHYPVSFRFLIHGAADMPCLDHGHRVFAAFHPGRPEAGCMIFNGEVPGSPRNRDRLKLGQLVGTAEFWPDVPQEDFSGRADYGRQKRAAAAQRTEFRAAFAPGAGGLIQRSTAVDAYGRRAAELSRNMPPAPGPEEETAPARTRRSGTAPAPRAERGRAAADPVPMPAPAARRASGAGSLVSLYGAAAAAAEEEDA